MTTFYVDVKGTTWHCGPCREHLQGVKVKTLMTTCEAAEYLTLSSKTLTLWRKNQTGPAYVKMGPRSIRYRLEDLDEFVANKTREKADK